MKAFRKLTVWEKGHQLTLVVYKATRSFPRDELYGLTSQLRRLASSIPADIAEGCGRSGDAELARFLQIAAGSASETEYHLLLSRDLEYLNETDYVPLSEAIVGIQRMLTTFIQKLRS